MLAMPKATTCNEKEKSEQKISERMNFVKECEKKLFFIKTILIFP